jgi:hypothetical protein
MCRSFSLPTHNPDLAVCPQLPVYPSRPHYGRYCFVQRITRNPAHRRRAPRSDCSGMRHRPVTPNSSRRGGNSPASGTDQQPSANLTVRYRHRFAIRIIVSSKGSYNPDCDGTSTLALITSLITRNRNRADEVTPTSDYERRAPTNVVMRVVSQMPLTALWYGEAHG